MNKSGHQVLTIKTIHYPTMPRDCVCKILLSVKDKKGKEEKKKRWLVVPINTNDVITWQQHIRAASKPWFHCKEPKVSKRFLC